MDLDVRGFLRPQACGRCCGSPHAQVKRCRAAWVALGHPTAAAASLAPRAGISTRGSKAATPAEASTACSSSACATASSW